MPPCGALARKQRYTKEVGKYCFLLVRLVFTQSQYENSFKISLPHKLLSSAAALLTGLTPFQQLESSVMQLLVRPPSLIERTRVNTSCCDYVVSFRTNTAYLVHHKLMFTPSWLWPDGLQQYKHVKGRLKYSLCC